MSKLSGVVNVAVNAKARLDSWVNFMTGLGDATRDKLVSTDFRGSNTQMTMEMAETLYHEDDIAALIAEAIVEDALRNGYTLNVENEEDTSLPSEALKYRQRLLFDPLLEEAAIWSRVFGGSVMIMGIDDGQTMDKPVNMKNVRSVRYLTVLDRRMIMPFRWYSDPLNDVKYGLPEIYQMLATPVSPQGTETPVAGVHIHESRLLRFDGARTNLRRRLRNVGWCDSVYQKLDDVMKQFNIGWQATAHLLQDASQAVFKIDGLMEMISSGDKDVLTARMQLVDMSRSVARAIMLDAEKESFERANYNFAGVPDVLRVFMLRLASAARMPVTRLMGQSPAGLNATGDADIRLWYDTVQRYQTHSLKPQIRQFHEIVFAAQDYKGDRPEDWDIKFARLWQMTDGEQADLELKTAQKDHIYIDDAVLLAEEVAVNRFKAHGFSQDTQIDMDARDEMLKAELDLAKSKAGEEPVPPSDGNALPKGANGGPGTLPGQPPIVTKRRADVPKTTA